MVDGGGAQIPFLFSISFSLFNFILKGNYSFLLAQAVIWNSSNGAQGRSLRSLRYFPQPRFLGRTDDRRSISGLKGCMDTHCILYCTMIIHDYSVCHYYIRSEQITNLINL
jgi:hypothetical protein